MGSRVIAWLIEGLPLAYPDAVVVVGSAVLGIAAGVLGAFAVLRGRTLVGDALAHASLPGVCIAFLLTGTKDLGPLLVGAAGAGLLAALAVVGLERAASLRPDAAIGVVLTGAFSLGVVLLTAIAHGQNANQAGLERYLFGQAAGLLEADVTVMATLSLAAVGAVALGFRALKTTLFDAGFAGSVGLPVRALEVAMTVLLVAAIVVGLRTVGAILMVAMLVVPATAARQLTSRLSVLLPLAGLLGAAVGVTGSLLSVQAALPTGPVVVLVGVALVIACLAFAPGRGVVWSARRVAAERRRSLIDGVLVDLHSTGQRRERPSEDELALSTGRTRREVRRAVRLLDARRLLDRSEEALWLSADGTEAATAALARRRLWSLWLEHGARLALPDAREPDPTDVRGTLGDDATDRLLALAGTGTGTVGAG